MKSIIFPLLFFVASSTVYAMSGLQPLQGVQARTEEVLDGNNNNLSISMEAPDDWNSGKLSAIILSADWKLSGVFATNFASKLFGSGQEAVSFFGIINAPSVVNPAIPFVQKLGLLSFALSQFVTLNNESDITLSDGSPAHSYSISATLDQLRKLKAPIDKALDAVLVTTQQGGKTYIIIYATEAGRMSQYQTAFDSMLRSVTIGTASFSNS